jgi:hypothetical protein
VIVTTSIDLARAFVELTEEEENDAEKAAVAIRLARARSLNRALAWTTVLESRYVVVLGEAGSGKSTEFQQQHDRLRARDPASAFLVPLTDMSQRGLFESLYRDEVELLRRRLDAGAEVTLFLDSVDEGKLAANPGKTFLADVLRRLESDLGDATARARIVLSCRGSDWRREDRGAIERLRVSATRIAQHQEVKDVGVRVFHLIPLDDGQVGLLAAHQGVPDIDGMMAAIRESDSRALVERPMDVLWLGAYWAANGRLGTRSELLENNVIAKLRDKSDRLSDLTDRQALKAVERLAGIATLSATRTFALPGGELDYGSSTTSVDCRLALQSLPVDQVEDLLSRGLFDSATFGRVRIHDGAVQEYLAARWLRRLLEEGESRTRIANILFRETGAGRVVPFHLRGAAAWLAAWDPRTKRHLLDLGPELLISEGDPSQIPPEDRKTALKRWTELLRTGARAQQWFDRAALSRFGSPALAGAICALLEEPELPRGVEELLFEIAAQARLAECVPRAHRRALDPTVHPDIRSDATRTVCRAGTEEQRQALVTALEGQESIPEQVMGALVSELFPGEVAVPTLLRLLAVVDPPDPRHVTVLTAELDHYIPNALDQHRALLLLRGVLDLATEKIGGRRKPRERYGWLLKHVSNLLVAVLRRDPSAAAEVVDETLSLYNSDARSNAEPVLDSSELCELITTSAQVRRRIFWFVARATAVDGGVIAGRFVFLSRFFQLSAADLAWLAEDAERLEHADQRMLAFDSALQIAASPEEDAILEQLMVRVPEFRTRHLEYQRRRSEPNPAVLRLAELARESNRREAARRKQREHLTSQLDTIAQGRQLDALMDVLDAARAREGDIGSLDLERAIAAHGQEVVDAARSGLKRCWRDNDAPVAAADVAVPPYQLMLAGIALEIEEDNLDVAQLPQVLQARLVRLATWEVARFPRWLAAIAVASPSAVREVLGPALLDEIRSASVHPQQTILWMVSDAPESVRRVCAPIIVRGLLETEPPRQSALEASIATLLTCRTELSDLNPVLEPRCGAALPDTSRFAVWWCAWLEMDSSAALAGLEAVLGTSGHTHANLLTAIGDRVWRWAADEPRGTGLPLKVRNDADAAAGLLALFEHYLPDEEDAHTYVGPEGHTRLLRERLAGWLSAMPGERAVAALERVAERASLPRRKSYFRELALRRASRSESCLPMSVRDATDWAERCVCTPTSARGLFDLALERLQDLKADIERGDHSIRPIVNPEADEPDLTTYVVSELENDAHGLYTVGREEEVDRRKKTDIRLHCPGVGPVVIEVKIAERQTGPALEDALPDQLVGRYMRDRRSEFGILLVLSLGDAKEVWQTRDGRTLRFAEFVDHLVEMARDLERTASSVTALRVVSIDMH